MIASIPIRGPYRPYASLPEEVEITVSKNYAIRFGDVDIDVYIEAPSVDGFKTLRINLPTMNVEYVSGMSDEEVLQYKKYITRYYQGLVDKSKEIV